MSEPAVALTDSGCATITGANLRRVSFMGRDSCSPHLSRKQAAGSLKPTRHVSTRGSSLCWAPPTTAAKRPNQPRQHTIGTRRQKAPVGHDAGVLALMLHIRSRNFQGGVGGTRDVLTTLAPLVLDGGVAEGCTGRGKRRGTAPGHTDRPSHFDAPTPSKHARGKTNEVRHARTLHAEHDALPQCGFHIARRDLDFGDAGHQHQVERLALHTAGGVGYDARVPAYVLHHGTSNVPGSTTVS
jgi:hypothetical protein